MAAFVTINAVPSTFTLRNDLLFSIEVPGCRAHGDDDFRIHCGRAFQVRKPLKQ
jgi:hypothetical protein